MASYYVLGAANPPAKDEGCPSLSTPGSAEGGYLDLCPMARYCALMAARPLVKDENCPTGSVEERHLNLASHYALAAASPLTKDENCTNLSTSGSNERDLKRLETSGHAAPAPAPTDSQSLTTPSLAAYSTCLVCSSTTYPMAHPRPHRRALHVSLVLI